jgi:6,7-dimethyl-8-ribityllumazine synthase
MKAGAPEQPARDGSGLRVGVVAARWHADAADALLVGALAGLASCGVEQPEVVRVPGAMEVPVVAAAMADRGCDAVVALAVVIRGDTPHFDYVCQAVTDGCLQVSLRTGIPVGFGVLTCDTPEQAVDRSGGPGAREDKGREAALAAVDTALVLRDLSTSASRAAGFRRVT